MLKSLEKRIPMRLMLETDISLSNCDIFIPYQIRYRYLSYGNINVFKKNNHYKLGAVLECVMYTLLNKIYWEKTEENLKKNHTLNLNGEFFNEVIYEGHSLAEALYLFNTQISVFNELLINLDEMELSYLKKILINCFTNHQEIYGNKNKSSNLVIKNICSNYPSFNSFIPRWITFCQIINPSSSSLNGLFFLSILFDEKFFTDINNISIPQIIDEGFSYIDVYKDANDDRSIYYAITKKEDGLDIYKKYLPLLKRELLDLIQNKNIQLDPQTNEYEKFVFSSSAALANYFFIKYSFDEILDKNELIKDMEVFKSSLLERLFSRKVDIYMALWSQLTASLINAISFINETFNENFIIETSDNLKDLACFIKHDEDSIIVNKEIIINLSIIQDKRFYSIKPTTIQLLLKSIHHYLDQESDIYYQAQYAIDYNEQALNLNSQLLKIDPSSIQADYLHDEIYYYINHQWGNMNVRLKCLKDLSELLSDEIIGVPMNISETFLTMQDSTSNDFISFAAFVIKAPIDINLLKNYIWQSFNENFANIKNFTTENKLKIKRNMLKEIMQSENNKKTTAKHQLLKF